ncbi:MAG: caspase family protein [Roseateles sp.]|uniref:caspase family protein n=1 Tax=Roseateles sp. TaxID=1971397 RepID=UPI004035B3AF
MTPSPDSAVCLPRRHVCGTLLGSLAAPLLPGITAAAAPLPSTEVRLALLMGNRSYPTPFDLPPIPKNLRDMEAVLARRGFRVTSALDLDLPAARRVLEQFIAEAAASPADATVFFYFGGHGIQVDASNLLLPAGLSPSAKGELLQTGSVQLLSDVVRRLPARREGMIIAVVDACRTGLRAGEVVGLNQVEAPPGCLITFSTGAGKPAIAPAVETQNTFYTGSLVKLMNSVSDQTTFPELMQLVRSDVRETMLNHPVAAVRELAQDPFIADHTRVRLTVEPKREGAAAPAGPDINEEAELKKLEQLAWPAEVVQVADAFLKARPDSPFAPGVQVARDGARAALAALRRNDVRLFRAAFSLNEDMPNEQRQDLLRCGRGDKDAAARMAWRFRGESSGGGDGYGRASSAQSRYEGWMQFAVALGNGIASYELALHFRKNGQPLLASQFEARARDLGYTPPPDLDNVRK